MTVLEFNYQISIFQDKLRAFAISLTNNFDDAQDLYQETVLKALRYKDKFNAQTNLKAWMYTIMKNTFINDYRRRKMSKTFFDDSTNEYVLNGVKATTESAISRLNTQGIMEKITSLDEDLKIPFLKYYEGFKYKEISESLNLPIGTVKSRIFLARKKLMGQLSEYSNG
jgi:RNA polymerase sigma-70 factor (ECF subfamily)